MPNFKIYIYYHFFIVYLIIRLMQSKCEFLSAGSDGGAVIKAGTVFPGKERDGFFPPPSISSLGSPLISATAGKDSWKLKPVACFLLFRNSV
jgi:hypothetical protein